MRDRQAEVLAAAAGAGASASSAGSSAAPAAARRACASTMRAAALAIVGLAASAASISWASSGSSNCVHQRRSSATSPPCGSGACHADATTGSTGAPPVVAQPGRPRAKANEQRRQQVAIHGGRSLRRRALLRPARQGDAPGQRCRRGRAGRSRSVVRGAGAGGRGRSAASRATRPDRRGRCTSPPTRRPTRRAARRSTSQCSASVGASAARAGGAPDGAAAASLAGACVAGDLLGDGVDAVERGGDDRVAVGGGDRRVGVAVKDDDRRGRRVRPGLGLRVASGRRPMGCAGARPGRRRRRPRSSSPRTPRRRRGGAGRRRRNGRRRRRTGRGTRAPGSPPSRRPRTGRRRRRDRGRSSGSAGRGGPCRREAPARPRRAAGRRARTSSSTCARSSAAPAPGRGRRSPRACASSFIRVPAAKSSGSWVQPCSMTTRGSDSPSKPAGANSLKARVPVGAGEAAGDEAAGAVPDDALGESARASATVAIGVRAAVRRRDRPRAPDRRGRSGASTDRRAGAAWAMTK